MVRAEMACNSDKIVPQNVAAIAAAAAKKAAEAAAAAKAASEEQARAQALKRRREEGARLAEAFSDRNVCGRWD